MSVRRFPGIPDHHAAAADTETVRKVIEALGLGHPDFIAVRSRWKDQLSVFK